MTEWVTAGISEEFKLEQTVRRRDQRSRHAADPSCENWEILQVVRADIAVAGVVRRDSVVVEIDANQVVVENPVRREAVVRSRDDVDAASGIERNDVAALGPPPIVLLLAVKLM